MPQQINLCTPILLTQKRYFSAQTMLQVFTVFLVLGGGLCIFWVWSLNVASEEAKKILTSRALELQSLESAIKQGRASAGPAEAALMLEIQNKRTALLARDKLLEELQGGLFQPGWGHSARLLLVAQSIPSPVWLTEVKADAFQLEVSGFTLEPVALNEWVGKLSASPLLKGQKLATVKVENTSDAMAKATGGAALAMIPGASAAMPIKRRPVWSFSLLSALGKPSVMTEEKP